MTSPRTHTPSKLSHDIGWALFWTIFGGALVAWCWTGPS